MREACSLYMIPYLVRKGVKVKYFDPSGKKDVFKNKNIEYCKNRGYPNLLAHGFQVLIQTAAGAGNFAHLISDSLVAFVEQSSKFIAPVFSGDTVYPELEISELRAQNTTGLVTVNSRVHNQRKELVLEGIQKYVVRKRSSIGK